MLKMCLSCRAPTTRRSRFTILFKLEAKHLWWCWGTWPLRTGPWWFQVDQGAICTVGYCRQWYRRPAYSSRESASSLTCICLSFNIFCEFFVWINHFFLVWNHPPLCNIEFMGKLTPLNVRQLFAYTKQMQITYLRHIFTILPLHVLVYFMPSSGRNYKFLTQNHLHFQSFVKADGSK